MAGLSPKSASRAGAGSCLALLVTCFLPGCEDGYDQQLSYPLRTDPIVLSRPSREKPTKLDAPGQLDHFINTLPVDKKDDLLKPADLPAEKKAELAKELDKAFGTPSKPKLGEETDAKMAADLAEGSKLYRRHCMHCHGLTGDGRGPTAPWVNPHPRDYRLGKFKFTSSSQPTGSRRAARADLHRTITTGIDGTSMPAFALLEDKEVDALSSYVIHLSVRGSVELSVMKELAGDPKADVPEEVEKSIAQNLRAWADTDKKRIDPPKAPEYMAKVGEPLTDAEKKQHQDSIVRGTKLFLTGSAKCVSCHNDFGRANDYSFDDWGTIVRPANLTAGTYRGGRRPLDLFYRMHSGINGSGMPAFDNLPPQDLWDVVNFIQALPYPNMLPDDVREQVYGKK